jgi:rfaE bifunctional protein kinase chain/domain
MKSYISVVESFKKLTVLVIGDVMLDEYVWGKVERISPEAPIPVVSIERREERLGGAANVALNLKTLGAHPIICSVIGNDAKGKLFKRLCKKAAISTDGLLVSQHRPTTSKTRIIGHSQHLLRVDDEIDTLLNSKEEKDFLKNLAYIISSKKIDAVVFEDYDKGCITANVIHEVTQLALQKKIPVTVDPKHRNFMNYSRVTLFKPNLKELAIGLKTDIHKETLMTQLPELCKTFMKQQHIETMLVTLSEHGMFIINKTTSHHIPTQVQDLADVSGAGDTVIATATLCLALKIPLYDVACIANAAAGIVCERVGVVPIYKDELILKVKS